MKNVVERLYAKKYNQENLEHFSPSIEEELSYEYFLQHLTSEQKKLFRVYEYWLHSRLEELTKEIFIVGFDTGNNQDLEILKLNLNRP